MGNDKIKKLEGILVMEHLKELKLMLKLNVKEMGEYINIKTKAYHDFRPDEGGGYVSELGSNLRMYKALVSWLKEKTIGRG